jgi:copper transport protein
MPPPRSSSWPARPPVSVAAAWAGLLLLLTPASAFAHAELLASDPPDLCLGARTSRDLEPAATCDRGVVLDQPPTSIRLTYSEAVQPIGGGVTVRAPDGTPVELGRPRAEGRSLVVDLHAVEQGTYVVGWRVVSEDTHPTRGSFVYSVGHPSATGGAGPTSELGGVAPLGLALAALARVLHFVGFALAFGVLLGAELFAIPHPGVRALVLAGLALLLLAEPVALLGQSASLGPEQALDPDLLADIAASSFGRVLAWRLAVALLLWVLLGAAGGIPTRPAGRVGCPGRSRLLVAGAGALAVALAVIDGQAAHAISARPEWLAFLANAAHLLAMAAWVGGLVLLVRSGRDGSARPNARTLALVALGTLVVTGTVMAFEHLTAPAELVTSPYGRTLLVKLGVLLVAVALAAGATRVGPRVGRRLRRYEALALAAVLVAAGVLVSLPPPA